MKKTNVMVFCKNINHGELDFFLSVNGEEVYMFTTNYFSRNIYESYKNGQRIEKVFENTSKCRQQKLKERILRMSRYIAEEESITLSTKFKKPIYMDDYDKEVA